MENFFIYGEYYEEFEDFLRDYQIETASDVDECILKTDTWEAELTTLEPIFKMDEKQLEEQLKGYILEELYDRNEDRYPEDIESTEKDILKAFTKSFDYEKFNSLVPKLWYPNGKFVTIDYQMIVDYFKDN